VNVVTSASTVISNSDGSTNPVLTNGELVDVAGTFDTTNNVLDATTITIHVGALPPPPAMVFGLVTAESLANNTITLTVNGCGGFQPDSTSLTVNVTPNTTYVDLSGVTDTEAQFFGNLVLGTTNIQVQGTQSGSAMTANSIRIVPPMIIGGGGGGGGNSGGGGPMTVSVGGPVSNVDASADTFSLTVAQWTGGWETPNMVLSVVTTPTTTYRANSTDISAAVFFSQLATSSVVHVRGTLDPTTSILTADSMGLIPPPGFKKG